MKLELRWVLSQAFFSIDKTILLFLVPVWAKALLSLLLKYCDEYGNYMWGDLTNFQDDIFIAMVGVIKKWRGKTRVDGESILKFFHEKLEETCSKRFIVQQMRLLGKYNQLGDIGSWTWDYWDETLNQEDYQAFHDWGLSSRMYQDVKMLGDIELDWFVLSRMCL